MEPLVSKLFTVTLLLTIAGGTVSAFSVECDFRFTRSANGKLSHFEVNDQKAVLELGANSTWKAYIKRGSGIFIGDQTGNAVTSEFSSLPKNEQILIGRLLNKTLDANLIVGQGDQVTFNWKGNSGLRSKFEKNGSISVKGTGLFGNLFAGNLPMAEHTHMLLQGENAVTYVPRSCDGVIIMPTNMLDRKLKKVLIEGSKNFDN